MRRCLTRMALARMTFSRIIFSMYILTSMSSFFIHSTKAYAQTTESHLRILNLTELPEPLRKEVFLRYPIFQTTKFTQEDLDNLVRFLMTKSTYDSVEVTMRKSETEEIYQVSLSQTQAISSLKLKGVFHISESDVLNTLGLSVHESFDPQTLNDGIESVRRLYQQKGFRNVAVDVELPSENKQNVDIILNVREGDQSHIAHLNFNSPNRDLNSKLQIYFLGKTGQVFNDSTITEMQKEAREFFARKMYIRAELNTPKIDWSDDQSSVTLNFDVSKTEQYEFDFDGNKKFSNADLLEALDLQTFFSATPNLGPELSTRIKKFYQSKAFARADVRYEEAEPKPNKRELTFHIDEGPRIEIEEYNITGHISRPQSDYVQIIRDYSTDYVKRGYYVREDVDKSFDSLQTELHNQGFLKARVVSSRVQYNKEKDKVKIFVNLEEGPTTLIENIRFDGISQETPDQLLNLLNLRPKTALKLKNLETGISNIRNYYRNKGFLEMDIVNDNENLILFNSDNTQASLIIKIYEGPKISVGSILIEGNSLTRENVILKELEFKKGDVLTPALLDESTRRLQRLGFFNSVNIQTLEQKSQVAARTVVIRVSEREPGLFNMGIGLSNENVLTLRGYLGVAYRNIEGTGRTISARIEGDYNVTYFRYFEDKVTIGYLEPYIFDTRIRGRVNATRSRKITDYSTQQVVETNQTTWSLEQDLTSHVTLIWDVLSVATYRDSYLTNLINPTTEVIATTGPTLDIDFRDSPFNPTRGHFTKLNLEYANPALGGDDTIEYYRTDASFTHYQPFWKGPWVWANSVHGGYLENLSKLANGGVPYDKKGFILGGRSTIRGFVGGTNEVFPNAGELPSNPYFLKGNTSYYLVKTEMRFPIYNNFGGAVFYDGGQVKISDFNLNYGYRDAAGVALRYNTPFGPVNFELAWKLQPLAWRQEDPYAFYFSIGTF